MEGVGGASCGWLCGVAVEVGGVEGGGKNVVVDAAVFVVDDEQSGVGPEIGVIANAVVDVCDEVLTGADIVVGVLVGRIEETVSVGRGMIFVVGLDEGVFGELVGVACGEEVGIGAEELGLLLEEVDNFEGGAGLVVVVELGGVAGGGEALVDTLEFDADVEGVHADVSEGGAVVGEGAVAKGGARDRGEPAIEDGELGGEGVEDGEIVGRVGAEVVDDAV